MQGGGLLVIYLPFETLPWCKTQRLYYDYLQFRSRVEWMSLAETTALRVCSDSCCLGTILHPQRMGIHTLPSESTSASSCQIDIF